MNILMFAGLSDHQIKRKITPILALDFLETVFLLRNTSLSLPKVQSYSPPSYLNVFVVREIYKVLLGIYLCITRKIDYVCGFYFTSHGLFASLLGTIFRIPVIIVFIGDDVDFCLRSQKFWRGTLKRSFRIGVRGTRSRDRMNAIIGEEGKFFIHHNVFSVDIPQTQENHSIKDIDLICVANFAGYKRIDLFLYACYRLKKIFPVFKAVMVGGGRRHRYERLRSRLGLVDTVEFAGKVGDVYSYLRRSRVFILTSDAEGLPMAMIEAMAAGVPCVVPDVGDITDIAENGKTAMVVPPGRPDVFTEAVRQLLENRELADRLVEGARLSLEQKREEFSLSHNIKIWEQILEKTDE